MDGHLTPANYGIFKNYYIQRQCNCLQKCSIVASYVSAWQWSSLHANISSCHDYVWGRGGVLTNKFYQHDIVNNDPLRTSLLLYTHVLTKLSIARKLNDAANVFLAGVFN